MQTSVKERENELTFKYLKTYEEFMAGYKKYKRDKAQSRAKETVPRDT